MNWFLNKNIRFKLIASVSFVSFITLIVAFVGWSGLRDSELGAQDLYQSRLLGIERVAAVESGVLEATLNIEKVVNAPSTSDAEKHMGIMKKALSKADKNWKEYVSGSLSEDEKLQAKKFEENFKLYKSNLDAAQSFIAMGVMDEVKVMLGGDIETFYIKVQESLDQLTIINQKYAEETKVKIEAEGAVDRLKLLLFTAIGIIISLTIAFWLASKIGNPLKKLTETADKLALGDVDISIDSKTTDEIGTLEKSFSSMIEGIKEKVAAAEKIAAGDLTVMVNVRSEEDALSKSMQKVVESVKGLVAETVDLSKAAVEGKLSTRGNADKYYGGYKAIIAGVNSTLDAVVAPLHESSEVLNKIAAGDLTARMVGNYSGDFESIKENINHLAESFNNALSDVSAAIQATASASSEISSSAEEMAAGAQEQSSQTSEVASAVDEMTKTIMDTTQNASSASETAKNAGSIAKEGGRVVSETIQGMNRIASVVKESAETVHQLGKSSDQIGEIVQVIDDIADQTNLLALNAAIEAARAGEQGRGFAVVADEVRKLAERTTKATKEIANMIKQIQKDTSEAVISMTSGTVEVERGKELADEAGKSLSQIITGAQQVVDIVTQVAAASEEQSSAAEQISKNLEAINHVTNESATGIQQIARASEDLNRLTINLQELISRFKISDNSHNYDYKRGQLAVHPNGTISHN
ncbi:MAG: methyl-accepting chemotaxis protein [Stygiobacter sp.]|nr:MAG: methyl-accepting chemotaxis protein [Stygiobacter sp.]